MRYINYDEYYSMYSQHADNHIFKGVFKPSLYNSHISHRLYAFSKYTYVDFDAIIYDISDRYFK